MKAHPDRNQRARQADRLARILAVQRLIQGRGKWNAKAIAQELEVTELTSISEPVKQNHHVLLRSARDLY